MYGGQSTFQASYAAGFSRYVYQFALLGIAINSSENKRLEKTTGAKDILTNNICIIKKWKKKYYAWWQNCWQLIIKCVILQKYRTSLTKECCFEILHIGITCRIKFPYISVAGYMSVTLYRSDKSRYL